MQLTKLLSGIDIGSIVYHKRYGECRVSLIEHRFLPSKAPWLRGNNKKKDGSWSERELHLFSDWELHNGQ